MKRCKTPYTWWQAVERHKYNRQFDELRELLGTCPVLNQSWPDWNICSPKYQSFLDHGGISWMICDDVWYEVLVGEPYSFCYDTVRDWAKQHRLIFQTRAKSHWYPGSTYRLEFWPATKHCSSLGGFKIPRKNDLRKLAFSTLS